MSVLIKYLQALRAIKFPNQPLSRIFEIVPRPFDQEVRNLVFSVSSELVGMDLKKLEKEFNQKLSSCQELIKQQIRMQMAETPIKNKNIEAKLVQLQKFTSKDLKDLNDALNLGFEDDSRIENNSVVVNKLSNNIVADKLIFQFLFTASGQVFKSASTGGEIKNLTFGTKFFHCLAGSFNDNNPLQAFEKRCLAAIKSKFNIIEGNKVHVTSADMEQWFALFGEGKFLSICKKIFDEIKLESDLGSLNLDLSDLPSKIQACIQTAYTLSFADSIIQSNVNVVEHKKLTLKRKEQNTLVIDLNSEIESLHRLLDEDTFYSLLVKRFQALAAEHNMQSARVKFTCKNQDLLRPIRMCFEAALYLDKTQAASIRIGNDFGLASSFIVNHSGNNQIAVDVLPSIEFIYREMGAASFKTHCQRIFNTMVLDHVMHFADIITNFKHEKISKEVEEALNEAWASVDLAPKEEPKSQSNFFRTIGRNSSLGRNSLSRNSSHKKHLSAVTTETETNTSQINRFALLDNYLKHINSYSELTPEEELRHMELFLAGTLLKEQLKGARDDQYASIIDKEISRFDTRREIPVSSEEEMYVKSLRELKEALVQQSEQKPLGLEEIKELNTVGLESAFAVSNPKDNVMKIEVAPTIELFYAVMKPEEFKSRCEEIIKHLFVENLMTFYTVKHGFNDQSLNKEVRDALKEAWKVIDELTEQKHRQPRFFNTVKVRSNGNRDINCFSKLNRFIADIGYHGEELITQQDEEQIKLFNSCISLKMNLLEADESDYPAIIGRELNKFVMSAEQVSNKENEYVKILIELETVLTRKKSSDMESKQSTAEKRKTI